LTARSSATTFNPSIGYSAIVMAQGASLSARRMRGFQSLNRVLGHCHLGQRGRSPFTLKLFQSLNRVLGHCHHPVAIRVDRVVCVLSIPQSGTRPLSSAAAAAARDAPGALSIPQSGTRPLSLRPAPIPTSSMLLFQSLNRVLGHCHRLEAGGEQPRLVGLSIPQSGTRPLSWRMLDNAAPPHRPFNPSIGYSAIVIGPAACAADARPAPFNPSIGYSAIVMRGCRGRDYRGIRGLSIPQSGTRPLSSAAVDALKSEADRLFQSLNRVLGHCHERVQMRTPRVVSPFNPSIGYSAIVITAPVGSSPTTSRTFQSLNRVLGHCHAERCRRSDELASVLSIPQSGTRPLSWTT